MNINLSDVLDRISSLEKVKTDAEIAHVLQVSPQTMSTWKRRGTVPYERICSFCSSNGYSLDYILLGEKTERPEIDVELFNEVISAVRAPSSELRGVKLELLIDQIIVMYNSILGITSKTQREKILCSYINIVNKQVISNADEQILKFVEQSAPFFEENPEVIDNLPDSVRTRAKRVLKETIDRRTLLKVTSSTPEDDELSA